MELRNTFKQKGNTNNNNNHNNNNQNSNENNNNNNNVSKRKRNTESSDEESKKSIKTWYGTLLFFSVILYLFLCIADIDKRTDYTKRWVYQIESEAFDELDQHHDLIRALFMKVQELDIVVNYIKANYGYFATTNSSCLVLSPVNT